MGPGSHIKLMQRWRERGTVRPDDPASSAVEGTVGLEGVQLSLPSLLQPVRLESGRLRLAGTELYDVDISEAQRRRGQP